MQKIIVLCDVVHEEIKNTFDIVKTHLCHNEMLWFNSYRPDIPHINVLHTHLSKLGLIA